MVVGSGISGLVTARVLSEHFAHVTVLERDARPDGSAPRAGTPQSWHFHGLLPGGLLLAIQSLIVPLDALRRSPWPERTAAAHSGGDQLG